MIFESKIIKHVQQLIDTELEPMKQQDIARARKHLLIQPYIANQLNRVNNSILQNCIFNSISSIQVANNQVISSIYSVNEGDNSSSESEELINNARTHWNCSRRWTQQK